MEIPQLPLEILVHIATQSLGTFIRMLALPPLARFCRNHRKYILDKFTIIKVNKQAIKYIIGRRLHREDGPAVEYFNGTKQWYQLGKLHCDGDLPAYEGKSGYKAWYLWGMRHRDTGPAVEYPNGAKEWWQYGKLHREDEPAIIKTNGTVKYYHDNTLHRNGNKPAVIYPNGRKKYYNMGIACRPS